MKLIKKITKNLDRKEINQIIKLKNNHWKFGISSQKKWFNDIKNVHLNDLHIMAYDKKKLVGYVQLSKRNFSQKNHYAKYILFRTLVVDLEYRRKNISKKIMIKVNKIIKQEKLISFLLCKKKLIYFYKKFDWKIFNKRKFDVLGHKSKLFGMIYNEQKLKKKNKLKIFYNYK